MIRFRAGDTNVRVHALALLMLALSFALGARDLAATGAAVRARSASAAEQLAAGETELYLPAVCGYARCNCFTPDGDLADDPKSWQNQALATYFGAGSVNLID